MSNVSFLITDQNITVNYQGQTHIVSRGDALADKLIDAIKEDRKEEIPVLVDAATRIETFSKGMFTVVDSEILIDGKPAPGVLGNKIVAFANQGLPYEPLVRFAKNLKGNPSFRAVNELFQFLEKNDHPITDDGCFIAYKRVGDDFKDLYTHTMDNTVGSTVEMSRNEVNEDPTQTCSYGLHVANWDYACNHYCSGQGVMLEVKVNPADVVAVPVDYNQAKMRVCKYVVLGVVDSEHSTGTQLRNTGTMPVDDDCCACCSCCEGDCSHCGASADAEDEGNHPDEEICPHCGEHKDWCYCDEDEEDEEEYYRDELDDDEY